MKYNDILKQMQDMMIQLEELVNSEQEENSTDAGAYHRKYNEEEIQSEDLKKSEQEALIGEIPEAKVTTVAKGKRKMLTYTGKFEKDAEGNVLTDFNGNPIKEQQVKEIEVEARNVNIWSRSINDMSEEEKKAIQRKALMNIHAGEDKISNNDIRTRLVNDKIEFIPRYSLEEEKQRFKFTRVNEVDTNLQVPLTKFYINDELIYTMDIEKAYINDPMVALEYKYKDVNDEEKMDEVERLCYEIGKKTGVLVEPDEVFSYLDSGYLINCKDITKYKKFGGSQEQTIKSEW